MFKGDLPHDDRSAKAEPANCGRLTARRGEERGGCPPRSCETLAERHVRLEAVDTTLAAEAALLVATEGARRIELVVGVRPNHARAKALRPYITKSPTLATSIVRSRRM